MEFTFTNQYKPSRVDEIVDYLLGPRLWVAENDYPDFLDWADKTYKQLKKKKKRALVAFYHNEIVGVTIYQDHEDEEDALELKNLTVRPDKRGRYVASFLLRNTEIEGYRDFGKERIVCDAKVDNFAINQFLRKHHYQAEKRKDLYKLGAGEDVIYSKSLRYIEFLEERNRNSYLVE